MESVNVENHSVTEIHLDWAAVLGASVLCIGWLPLPMAGV